MFKKRVPDGKLFSGFVEQAVALGETPLYEFLCFYRVYLSVLNRRFILIAIGIVCIADADGVLQGIITDGDIRRMLSSVQKPLAALMSDDVIVHAIKSPTTVEATLSLQDAIDIMGSKQIWDLPVVHKGKLQGLLHLHPAISAILGASK